MCAITPARPPMNTDCPALQTMRGAAETKFKGKAETVVEVTNRKFGVREGEQEDVLKNLIASGALAVGLRQSRDPGSAACALLRSQR